MADDADQVRAAVVGRYDRLAEAAAAGQQVTDGGPGEACFGAAAYDEAAGLPEAALRASLGCGNPVAVAALNPGETVLDLGSGGGIDVLLSARRVGPSGRVYGLDGSPEMISLARANAAAAGARNVEFLHGSIEEVPLPDGHVDAVISNCVINLSADKPRVLAEAFRVLRPGGRLGVSDVIAGDGTDPGQRAAAEQRAGCTTGTVTAQQYRDQLLAAGFTRVSITPGGRRRRRPDLGGHPGHAARRPARRAHPADAGSRRQRGPGDLPGRAGHRAGQFRDHRPGLGSVRRRETAAAPPRRRRRRHRAGTRLGRRLGRVKPARVRRGHRAQRLR